MPCHKWCKIRFACDLFAWLETNTQLREGESHVDVVRTSCLLHVRLEEHAIDRERYHSKGKEVHRTRSVVRLTVCLAFMEFTARSAKSLGPIGRARTPRLFDRRSTIYAYSIHLLLRPAKPGDVGNGRPSWLKAGVKCQSRCSMHACMARWR